VPKPSKIRSDHVDNLAKYIDNKRVAVFIDAANLYYAGAKAGIRISFETIAAWFVKHSKHAELNFYTAFDPEGTEQLKFLDSLEATGYHVIKKPIKVFDTLTKGNMDIELAVDALTMYNEYDVIILMSGDGDFSYLVSKLKSLGKTTIIIGIGGFMSYELHKVGDHYYFLDRLGRIWQNKLKYNPQNYKIFLDTIEENDYEQMPHIIPETMVEPKPLVAKLAKLKLKPTRGPRTTTFSAPNKSTPTNQ
jgi:uncharacterized LabA/DUF88 family protein